MQTSVSFGINMADNCMYFRTVISTIYCMDIKSQCKRNLAEFFKTTTVSVNASNSVYSPQTCFTSNKIIHQFLAPATVSRKMFDFLYKSFLDFANNPQNSSDMILQVTSDKKTRKIDQATCIVLPYYRIIFKPFLAIVYQQRGIARYFKVPRQNFFLTTLLKLTLMETTSSKKD